MTDLIETANKHFIPVYQRYPVILDHGEGVYLYDQTGKKYLDFGSGIGVCALGYGHPVYTASLQKQLAALSHTSNLFYNEPAIQAARLFNQSSGMDKVFFTNSGTEAIEGAIKIAHKYHYLKTGKHDGQIIAMKNSFHGRTMGALSVTGKIAYQKPFQPLLTNVRFATFNDSNSVKALINEHTCAIILETIQGEGGIYQADQQFLHDIYSWCQKYSILLILDEIQCGMGRTGKMFAYQHYDIIPDIVVSAKALGCGVPVGAIGIAQQISHVLAPGDHGTTYGSNPLSAKAVQTVFEIYQQEHILKHVQEMGQYLEQKLKSIVTKYSTIKEIRGLGLMKGIELTVPAKTYIEKLQHEGIIVIPSGTHIMRLLPPLIIEKQHIDHFIATLEKILQ